MRLKVNEAILLAALKGKKIYKKDLAKVLYPRKDEKVQKVNMSNLCGGRIKRITVEQVRAICEVCECSADFLFGLENETNDINN